MQYQIICHSPRSYAKTFAQEYLRFLPGDTPITGTDADPAAPVQIICFEPAGRSPDTIPPEVTDYLRKLSEHSIFLLAVVPCEVSDLLERELMQMVLPKLPRGCDFLGLCAAPCDPSEQLLQALRRRCTESPENRRAGAWLERCEKAVGRPNQEDLDTNSRFARHILGVPEA